MDGWMDGWTDIHVLLMDRHTGVQCETIMPHHYHVAGYNEDLCSFFLYILFILAWI